MGQKDEGESEEDREVEETQSVWAEETTWAFTLSEVGAMEGPKQIRV